MNRGARTIRIGMAQINSTVGDLIGNSRKIVEYIDRAKDLGVDVVSFPELAVTGYPPEDLLLKPSFIRDNGETLKRIARAARGITAVVGFVDKSEDIYNSAAVLHNGSIAGVYHKIHLPNYGVFDEERYFRKGTEPFVFFLDGIGIGITICEDFWHPEGPAIDESLAGAEVIVNINASPYHMGKWRERLDLIQIRARENAAAIAYNNMVGGQDELVFDGFGMIADEKGNLLARGRLFEEDLVVADLDLENIFGARLHGPRRRNEESLRAVQTLRLASSRMNRKKPLLRKRLSLDPNPVGEVLSALIVGVRDYVRKNRFKKVVIGLSGGVDSALAAVISVDALGSKNVIGVFMPSRYTSERSRRDTFSLAKSLKIRTLELPIESVYSALLSTLKGAFAGTRPGIAEENIQARIRGNILMALSNKFGWLVLTTGNKSEMSTGYATLYGDMAGGFAIIKDVPKTLVYKIARYRNSLEKKPFIPESILRREPTAELKPRQRDEDTLPPYKVLDPILKAYVEEDKDIEEITNMGFSQKTVMKVIRMVELSEYKRRQAPPGVKITPRAIGKDRRMPITNRYNR